MTERKTRVILFRGKSNSPNRDSEWVYGGLIPETKDTLPIIVESCDNDDDTLYVDGWTTVDPETVGQYTGLTDMNGTEIFEGDILKHHVQSDVLINTGVVNWDSKNARWVMQLNTMNPCFYLHRPETVEVIGNIHDTPELLGGNHG